MAGLAIRRLGLETIRRRGIFFKTLGLLTLLSLLTMLIFGRFIDQIVVKKQRENIDSLNLHQLQRIGSDVELMFRLLAQSMTQSMWSDDLIQLMIAPNQHSADVAVRAIQILRNQVEENDLVRKAYLYLPSSDEVYVYSGNYMKLEYLGDRAVIYAYLAEHRPPLSADETSRWQVMLQDRRIFLVSDFCLPNFVGAMFFEIDRTELYDMIQAENERFDTTIYVYDQAGEPVFDYMAAALQPQDLSDQSLFLTLEGGAPGSSYYQHISEEMGWQYVVKIKPEADSVSFLAMARILCPVLALYVLVSQMFSLYITRSIYRPIERLIHIASSAPGAAPKEEIGNEADYLELAFRDSLAQNDRHRHLMREISHDILEQLMRGLLTGKLVSLASLRNTLEGVGRQELGRGRYAVAVLAIEYQQGDTATLVERELYQRSLLRLLEEIGGEGIIALAMDLCNIAVIVHLPAQSTQAAMEEQVQRLCRTGKERVRGLPYTVFTGAGPICDALDTIQTSYHQALEAIQYHQYMAGQEGAEAPDGGDGASRHFLQRAKHAYVLAEAGDVELAQGELEALVAELLQRQEDAEGHLQGLVDDVVERLIAWRVSQEEMAEAGISAALRQRDQAVGADAGGWMSKLYRLALPLIWGCSRKSHNRHVEGAKEYIASHYSDGALSLNQVGEAVGLSPSYLSGIFAEVAGVGVNGYLNCVRVEQAKRYLEETSLNISEIGYKCGFNSVQSFGRVFKKQTGLTPKQFRERL